MQRIQRATVSAAMQHGKRELSAGDLTDIGSTLVGTYTSKLNSITGADVVRQTSYMMAAAGLGFAIYICALRPNLAGQLAPKTKRVRRTDGSDRSGRTKKGKGDTKDDDSDDESTKPRSGRRRMYLARVWEATSEFFGKLMMPEDCTMGTSHLGQSNILLECGLDQLAYLRLLWMSYSIFAVCATFTLWTLPIADWQGHNPGKSYKDATFETISISDFTISGIGGDTLYFHIAAGYTVTVVVFLLMWWNSRELSAHRIKFFSHPGYLELKADVYKRCVLIADLGTSHQPDQIKAEILGRIKNIKELAGLKPVIRIYTPEDPENKALRMDAHNELVGALQQILNEHFAAGKGEDDELMLTPPGLLACAKNDVPALPYFKEALLENWSAHTINHTPHPYAVIGFAATAHVSYFVRESTSIVGRLDATQWEIDFAPTPNGLIWPNITMNARTRAARYLLGYGALLVLITIYTPPLAFIALLSNVAAVTKYFPTLQDFQKIHPDVFLAATTTVPPIMSATMFSVLPHIIHWIAYQQGVKTSRSLQSRTIHWNLAFIIFAQMMVFPSLSTIFTLLTTNRAIGSQSFSQDSKGVLKKIFLEIVFFLSQIPTTYQQQANYWLNWFALRWLLAVIQLLGGPVLAKQFFARFYRHLTAREKGDFEIQDAMYAQHIPQCMFMVALGLLYAPVVPFMTIFASVALFLLWMVHKVQALLLYQTHSETCGRFWLPECDRILLFLLFSQGMLGLTCGLQSKSAKMGLLMLPAPFATVMYRFWLRARFNQTLHFMTSRWARFQSAERPLTSVDLDSAFKFAPKALRLQFDEDDDRPWKPTPKADMAYRMLKAHGMHDALVPPRTLAKESEDMAEDDGFFGMPALIGKPVGKALNAVKAKGWKKVVRARKNGAFFRNKGQQADPNSKKTE